MKHLCCLAFAAALLPLPSAPPQDVFNTLQQNAWYLKTRDKAADLYVTELGKGEPVVFLHGGPGNDFHYIVDALRPHLERNRFILFDQRGSLMSPVNPKNHDKLTFDGVVEDLEQLREALGRDQLRIFGHSFGSMVALAYHRKYPARVKSLILCGTIPPDLPEGIGGLIKAMRPRQNALLGRKDEIAAILKAEGLPEDPKQDSPRQASMRWRISKHAPNTIIDLHRWRESTGGGVYYNEEVSGAIAESLTQDLNFSAALKAHPVPVTVLQGDQDYISPATPWQELAKSLPSVKVHTLPKASHYPWIDAPKPFHAGMKAALRER